MAEHVVRFGQLVCRHRVAAGLSQEDLAERAQLSVRALSNIERGRTTLPRRTTVSLLGEALGLAGDPLLEFVSAGGADPARADGGSRRTPRADGPRGADGSGGVVPVVPRQLPAGLLFFAGRGAERDALTGLLRRRDSTPGAAVICVLSGTAGVGKTALALHWAHLAASEFPDGQLFVNLRGFDPSAQPVTAAAAIRGFLDAMGIPPDQIPVSAEAQSSLYRGLLADRRMLVVLDDALDSGQVRPLLPPGPACVVLVTSRNQIADLVAAQAAQPLALDVLGEAAARELLALRLGAERLAAEPAAAGQIIDLCGGLPLALSITASRAAAHPHFPLAALAAEIRDTRGRLDVLETEPGSSGLRAALASSYQRLSPSAARVFRLLGVHPGPDVASAAVASVAGVAASQARAALAELHRASLLTEPSPNRFSCHDLLRVYAAEVLSAEGGEDECSAAASRMLDHYLYTAQAAGLVLYPHREVIIAGGPGAGVLLEEVTEYDQAMGWFEAEHRVLVAMVGRAAGAGQDTHAWQLSAALTTFLDRRGYWDDYVAVLQTALAAARRLGETGAQAMAGRSLGKAYSLLGRYDDACTHLTQALGWYQQLGDCIGLGRTHMTFGNVLDQQGRYAEVLGHCEQALSLFRDGGDRPAQAVALNNVGWCHARLGDYHQALAYCEQAMTLHQELGNAEGQASTWDSIGVARQHLGRHAEAVACYQQALSMFRELGDRFNQADVLVHLGDCHQAAAEPEAARDAWQQGLAILDELHHRDAEQVQARLQAHAAGRRPGRQVKGRAVGGIGDGSRLPSAR